ncbi:hypothetical protein LTR86_003118 [Recurvomyces mirabilis]|nr:hypothetical protein LTR86_003118 [Recurvomyces mirabilis]
MAVVPPTATRQVFDIPELLEQILVDLLFKWLLLSQRTSKAFNEAITASPNLRRKLYFEPYVHDDDRKPELPPFFKNQDDLSIWLNSRSSVFNYSSLETYHFTNRSLDKSVIKFCVSGRTLLARSFHIILTSMSAPLPTTKSMTTTPNAAAMASPTPTTAIHEVFQIAELLEQILLHLPFKWLLLSQRTSKGFQAAIAISPALRRKLYLEPSTTAMKPELAPFFVDHNTITDAHWSANPGFAYIKADPAAFSGSRLECVLISGEAIGVTDTKRSWHNMLITQPPLQGLRLQTWNFDLRRYDYEDPLLARREEGLRWSDVLEAAAVRFGRDFGGTSIYGFSGAPGGREVKASMLAWS